jgi:RNA polymerase sigma-70 factor, ECF subfamily
MAQRESDTDQLLLQAAGSGQDTWGELLERHRQRLERMVALRMDKRLAMRLDPADVVQETLAEAVVKLPAYMRDEPLPFYPWLRQLALDLLTELHRRHVSARMRTVTLEERWCPEFSNDSVVQLADRLLGRTSSPSTRLIRKEECERVRAALGRLASPDREVLVMRHLEQLPLADIAAVLGVTEGTTGKRHLRALERLRALLADTPGGKQS